MAYLSNDELLNISLAMDFKTLIQFCQVNTRINSICKDNTFWIDKLSLDYPFIYNKYILLLDTPYKNIVLNYIQENAKEFYGIVYDYEHCHELNNYSFIFVLHELSASLIDLTTFTKMLLLTYHDDTLVERLMKQKINFYSGIAIIASLLPNDFMYLRHDVMIINGILIKGVLTKNKIYELIEVLENDYGDDIALQFKMHLACLDKIYQSNTFKKKRYL